MALEQIGLAAVLDDRNFQQGLSRYTKGLGQMTSLTDGAAKMLSGAFIAGIGAVTVAASATLAAAKIGLDATLQWAEQLDKLGDQFGMSGQVASGWAFLMNRVGLSVDEGAQGLNYFTNQLGSFGKVMKDGKIQVTPFSDALAKLGVNAIDPVTKKVKTFDQLMPQIMDKFEKLPAGIDASALAMDLFGARGGTKFLDFLRQGAKGLDDAKKKAQEFGLDLSTDEVNAAEEFGFQMNELNLSFTGFKNIIGRAVLPIVKDLVSWLTSRALPVLAQLARTYVPRLIEWFKSLGDWASKYLLPRLREFTDWIFGTAIPFIQRLVGAFQKGGLIGVIQQLASEVQKAWPTISGALSDWGSKFWEWLTGKGGALEQLGAKMGELLTGIQTWIQQNGPSILAAFQGFATWFWGWVTSPSGVVATTAGNLVNVVKAIADWVGNPANTEGMRIQLLSWAGQFWDWITNPTSGVIATVADKMGLLATNIEEWAKDPKTQERFGRVGADIAHYILDGLGKVFDDKSEGDSALFKLWLNLLAADRKIFSAMMAIGKDISIAILSGLASIFTDPTTATNFATSITTMMQNAVAYVVSQLPFIFKPITDAWSQLFGGMGTPPVPPGGTPPGYPPNNWPYMQSGGFVPRDTLAHLHAGEYVLPASRVSSAVYNSRSIGAVSVTIQGSTGMGEAAIKRAVYAGIAEVLGDA